MNCIDHGAAYTHLVARHDEGRIFDLGGEQVETVWHVHAAAAQLACHLQQPQVLFGKPLTAHFVVDALGLARADAAQQRRSAAPVGGLRHDAAAKPWQHFIQDAGVQDAHARAIPVAAHDVAHHAGSQIDGALGLHGNMLVDDVHGGIDRCALPHLGDRLRHLAATHGLGG